MKKLEHIGIAVKNLEAANKLFSQLLGKSHYKIEEVASEGVRTSFFEVGDIKIELLESTKPHSPIAKFIESRGEGIHHLAFEVEDIRDNMKVLTGKGFQMTHDTPKPGADNMEVAFIHPKTTAGVLVELCQKKSTS